MFLNFFKHRSFICVATFFASTAGFLDAANGGPVVEGRTQPESRLQFSYNPLTFHEQYKKIEKLSRRDDHSKVFVFENIPKKEKYIIKAHEKEKEFAAEVSFYERIRSVCASSGKPWPSYIPKYHGVISGFKTSENLNPKDAFVMEYLEKYQALDQVDWSHMKQRFTLDNAKQLAVNASKDLSSLHTDFQLQIGHDLEGKNFMINVESRDKIHSRFIDFEYSSLLPKTTYTVGDASIGEMVDQAFDGKMHSSPRDGIFPATITDGVSDDFDKLFGIFLTISTYLR